MRAASSQRNDETGRILSPYRQPCRAAWLYPGAQIDAGVNFRHYAEITQIAERGKFDLMFVADAGRWRCAMASSRRCRAGPQYMAYFDPLTLLPALAAVTSHIGVVGTATTSYNEPYHIAPEIRLART